MHTDSKAIRRWALFALFALGCLGALVVAREAHAQSRHPEHWSFEMRGGLYNPTTGAMKNFFSGCCNVTAGLTGGWLLQSRFGVDAGASYMLRSGSAKGQTTGTTSQEPFSLLLIPATLEATFRADYHAGQRMVPYAKSGFDLVYFRENNDGRVIKGTKHGVHGGMGLMVLVNDLMEGGLGGEYGLNDVFFVLDGRYQWINNFGGGGLDLSGWTVSTGVHMQF